MAKVQPLGLFCDDIRDEKNGVHSLIGVYPDNVNVASIPSAIPKLGIYARIGVPATPPINAISICLVLSDGQEQLLTQVEPAVISQAQVEAKEVGLGTLISMVIATPFPLANEGRIRLLIRVDGEEFHCASVNFQVTPKPAGS